MPLYEFKCPECGHTEDVTLPVEQRNECRMSCTNCQAEMKRSFQPTGFQIEGKAYITRGSPSALAGITRGDI